jgi:hypothetical protein
MSIRGKPNDFFRVKILGMRLRIASAHLPYTCRNYIRICCRIPSLYRKDCVPRFGIKMTCDPSWKNRLLAGFLWAFQNWRKA